MVVMALRLQTLCQRALQTAVRNGNAGTFRTNLLPKRTQATVADVVPEKPEKVRFGWLKITFLVVPSLYLGATISKEGAAFLEENEIFVPSDDDDD